MKIMKRELKWYITLLAVFFLSGAAMAGDKKWTLSADRTEWLYTYTTKPYQGNVFVYVGGMFNPYQWHTYNIVGKITFSFKNDPTNRNINDRWNDFKMRVAKGSSGKVQIIGYYGYNNQYWTDLTEYYEYKDDDENDAFPFFFTCYESKESLPHCWTFPTKDVFNDGRDAGFEWDMDQRGSIKLFFETKDGQPLEEISIPRPTDSGAHCYSTTEGMRRDYRTNLFNRYNNYMECLNKSVQFAKTTGDGTYLFNPVWQQFITRNADGSVNVAKQYVSGALDWTGNITDNTVVEAKLNPKTGRYELSIDAPLPATLPKDQNDNRMHFLMQAIVRAEKDQVVQMNVQYYDQENQVLRTYDAWTGSKVKGVGISNEKDNQVFGTVYPTGRVDYLKRIANGGWLKLECPMKIIDNNTYTVVKNPVTAEIYGRMLLTSTAPFQVSDLFLLWRPNQLGFYQTSADCVNYGIKDNDINTSWVDLSSETKFSLFDRGDNLNRVIKVGANSIFAHEGHEHPCNVVINGRTPLLYLTDRGVWVRDTDESKAKQNTGVWADENNSVYRTSGYTFGVGEDFTADKVWFDRDFALKQYGDRTYSMSTICLPFAMDASDLQKFNVDKAHRFDYANGNKATFTEVYSTEANTPYLIEPSAAVHAHETPLEFTNKIIPASNMANGNFIGTYRYQTLQETKDGYTNYIFGSNTKKFNYVAPSGANLKPFRAYLRSMNSNDAKSFSLYFSDDTVNGIDQAIVSEENGEAPVYTIDGQLVNRTGDLSGLRKGVYIRNGKKIIIK
jgi:hypothetical protein